MLLLFRDGVLWRFSIPLSNTHILKTHETQNNTQNRKKSEKKRKKRVSNEKAKKKQKQYLLILARKPFRSWVKTGKQTGQEFQSLDLRRKLTCKIQANLQIDVQNYEGDNPHKLWKIVSSPKAVDYPMQ